jgi:glycosyltransferase involved in cell wall biosynthesis
MRFSVVVTAFDQGRYVGEAVESALAQSRRADEILLVDDGSTDGSGEWMEKEYAPCAAVTVLRKPNGGQLHALRAGFRASSGDVVCFLDADDRWQPGYLERLEGLYRERPEFDAVFANLRIFGGAEKRLWHAEERDGDLGLAVVKTYFGDAWEGSPTSAISMRRPLVEELLSLPERFDADWRVRADDVLVLGAALRGARRYYLAEPLVEYREHGANLWLGRSFGASEDVLGRLRRHALIRHFGRWLEPAERLRRLAKRELATKSRPQPEDLKAYLRVIREDPRRSWWARSKASRSLRRSYRALRRSDP